MSTNVDFDGPSEYDGRGVMPNTVYPKGSDALTASDKLRLQSITGQETDSRAPVDPYFWYGNVAPEPDDLSSIAEKAERLKDRGRYDESPGYPY